jgi:hypothetical protein
VSDDDTTSDGDGMSGQETSVLDQAADAVSDAYNTASDAVNWAGESMHATFDHAGATGGPGGESPEAKADWQAEGDRHDANAQYYFDKMKQDLGGS